MVETPSLPIGRYSHVGQRKFTLLVMFGQVKAQNTLVYGGDTNFCLLGENCVCDLHSTHDLHSSQYFLTLESTSQYTDDFNFVSDAKGCLVHPDVKPRAMTKHGFRWFSYKNGVYSFRMHLLMTLLISLLVLWFFFLMTIDTIAIGFRGTYLTSVEGLFQVKRTKWNKWLYLCFIDLYFYHS